MDPTKKCGECAYWCQNGPGGNEEPRGDCRVNPPSTYPMFMPPKIPGNPPMPAGSTSLYPNVEKSFPACSHFATRLAI